ncbi:LCT [Mytilus edulis]|uniref:LCT n=1 Tax=Mytilus edulis TaxID=6550 RepID=A0A8S3RSJ9_MYTED|nr:LCT [Mytilus edulis]
MIRFLAASTNISMTASNTPGVVSFGLSAKVLTYDSASSTCKTFEFSSTYPGLVSLLAAADWWGWAKHFKLQLSWTTTIQPLGDGPFNTEGLQHYHNVVIAYNEAGVSVMVELYHWDLPQALQDLGEWFNSTIVDKLAMYVDTCFQEYGLKVNQWITFHDPYTFIYGGYGTKYIAPGIDDPDCLQGCFINKEKQSHIKQRDLRQLELKLKKKEDQIKKKEAASNHEANAKTRLLDIFHIAESRNLELEITIKTLSKRLEILENQSSNKVTSKNNNSSTDELILAVRDKEPASYFVKL